ncbi:hypothetical protein HMPREF0766_13797 [Sphingobacterium spiritivorum ATCC 33861]|uniref:Uncharacterized protein n=1 Tax=Sphingobacterium spiritivorum ATCC 33861 TaxID=525373 RepID=D7VS43_SPHSI|nr:hypothetical protein HMPREF0766_13797 [Sphingobacterium spiritivorum ATCC 33861]
MGISVTFSLCNQPCSPSSLNKNICKSPLLPSFMLHIRKEKNSSKTKKGYPLWG